MIELHLLGGASLLVDGDPVQGPARRRHALALLAILATANRGVPRDRLLALLWPESDTERARNSLNVVLYRLRKAIGSESIVSSGDAVRLDVDRVACDVVRFEAALEAGDRDRAAAAYGGPFLHGFHLPESEEFETWARTERERLASENRRVLESLAVDAEAGGEVREAIRWWRRLLAEDPSNALVTVRLMEALEATGERGQALELAEAHETLLREEFAAEPDPEVVALAARLREAPNGVPHVTIEAVRDRAVVAAPTAPSPRSFDRRALGAIAAASIAAIAVVAFLLRAESPPIDARRVVAAPFENRTGDPALDHLGPIAADWLTQGLAQTGIVRVIPATDRAAALARQTGAGLVLTGSYFRHGDSIGFDVQIADAATGEVLGGVDDVYGSEGEPVDGIERLRQRTIGVLAALVDPRLEPWARTASPPPSLPAYQQFDEGMEAYLAYAFEEATDHFLEAAAEDSTFHTALVWAALAQRNTRRTTRGDSILGVLEDRRDRLPPWDRAMLEFLAADLRGNRRAAYHALERVVDRTPASDWHYLLGAQALGINRPHEALEHLLAVDVERGWIRDWMSYWPTLATTYHRLGRYEEEWAVIEEWDRRYPAPSLPFRVAEMRALAALGRIPELRERIESSEAVLADAWMAVDALVEELKAHGLDDLAREAIAPEIERVRDRLAEDPDHVDRRILLFELLYKADRYDAAWTELERVLDRVDVEDLDAWDAGYVGRLAARRGDRELVARVQARLRAIDDAGTEPVWRRALPTIQRALVHALSDDPRRATELLRVAIRDKDMPLGDQHPFFWDGDFASLEGYAPFEELVRPR